MSRPIKNLIALTVFLSSLLLLGFGEGASPAGAVDEIAPAETFASMAICEPDTPDMVAYWPLDDGAGASTFEDVVGVPSHPGACVSGKCPVSMSGLIDSAFYFDGVDEVRVTDEDALDFEIGDSFSFEMWVNTAQACPGDDPENNYVFIGKWSSGSSWWVGCSNDAATFSLRSSVGSETAIAGIAINDNNWHHVVAVREFTGPADGEGENRLYVDGNQVAIASRTYAGTFANLNPMTIGFHDNRYFYDGTLDEVAIYNRDLTLDEIQFHYQSGAGQSYCITPLEVIDPGEKVNDEGETIPLLLLQSNFEPGTTVAYTVSGLPPDLTWNADGLIAGTLTYEAAAGSPYTVQATVTNVDDPLESDSKTFSWTVNNVNRAPVITETLGDRSDAEGAAVSFQVEAEDPDEDQLAYAAQNLPPGVSIDASTGLISGTIAYNAFESGPAYTVLVTVSDDSSPILTDTDEFNWEISNANSAPDVTQPEDQTNTERETVSLQIVATDPDGDTLTYTASGLPDGLSIDTDTGLISGTLSLVSAGAHTVEVTVWDGFAGNEVIIGFTWTVDPEWQVSLPLVVRSIQANNQEVKSGK